MQEGRTFVHLEVVMKFDYRNIEDGEHFENLVADYFRDLKTERESSIVDVKVKQSGEGGDGGRDILVEFEISDEIVTFRRRWVVQCKFLETNVSPTHISKVNIPTLISSYNAVGYLLVCKKNPTVGITELFEKFMNNGESGCCYEVWNGDQFLKYCSARTNLHPTYFHDYDEWLRSKMTK